MMHLVQVDGTHSKYWPLIHSQCISRFYKQINEFNGNMVLVYLIIKSVMYVYYHVFNREWFKSY